eukprot:TRINITY_DN2336_c0_g1_i1.p1 TRINITY_DN2336_c0_g1~~TRINITY_DN2336_c0_g1_i1.p1  ORF type:complete len:192 (-),score=42.60 TRINITY_DN2336_c0_g1_i1:61-636(-)
MAKAARVRCARAVGASSRLRSLACKDGRRGVGVSSAALAHLKHFLVPMNDVKSAKSAAGDADDAKNAQRTLDVATRASPSRVDEVARLGYRLKFLMTYFKPLFGQRNASALVTHEHGSFFGTSPQPPAALQPPVSQTRRERARRKHKRRRQRRTARRMAAAVVRMEEEESMRPALPKAAPACPDEETKSTN